MAQTIDQDIDSRIASQRKSAGRSAEKPSFVSVVVPTFNEQDSLLELCSGINQVLSEHADRYEIIFVDDGSTDQSWSAIESMVRDEQGVRGIKFRRNFGKAAALNAGFAACQGDVVITMDADLQDDPTEIPRFLDKLASGVDVVSGWKKIRHDPWHKVLPSRVFNSLVSRLTGVDLHDHNCGFKAYRHGVIDDVDLYGERHRFVPVLAAEKGWKVGEIEVQHHARPFGKSKYGVSRIMKGFLDLLSIYFLTSFGRRPLHLIGTAGLVCFGLGAIGIVYLSARRLISHASDSIPDLHLHETAVFYYCILAVLLGAQFMLAGLLAELIVSSQGRNRHKPSIEKAID